LRKIITVYSKNYTKFIFFEQEEELIKGKESGPCIKEGASKINVCVCNKTQK
jgi:hypothetical protein